MPLRAECFWFWLCFVFFVAIALRMCSQKHSCVPLVASGKPITSTSEASKLVTALRAPCFFECVLKNIPHEEVFREILFFWIDIESLIVIAIWETKYEMLFERSEFIEWFEKIGFRPLRQNVFDIGCASFLLVKKEKYERGSYKKIYNIIRNNLVIWKNCRTFAPSFAKRHII